MYATGMPKPFSPVLSGPLLVLTACLVAGPAGALELHHEIAIRLFPDRHALEGVDRLTASGNGSLALRLSPAMELTGLSVDGRPYPGRAEGGLFSIPLKGGESQSIEIRYRGELPPGTEAEAMIAPEGTFLPGDAGWFPIAPADQANYVVTVAVPEGQRAVVTGTLIGEEAGPDGYRAVFEARHPEPPSLFAGPYQIAERRERNLRLRTYLHETAASLAEEYLRRSAELIEHFAERIGPYPFDHFYVVSAPLPVGLGFPGLTYIDRRILHLPFLREQSLPHEVLHNWWGSGVLVDPASGNWAEGLTTFMADYGLADAEGRHRMRLEWLRDYAALPSGRDLPLRRFTAKAHDADQIVGYGKAAFVFHMLRRHIGDADFDAGLRLFWRQHRMQAAGWGDLRRAFEEASGSDLGRFFAQWLDRPGAPRLLPPQGRAQDRSVTLTLRQEAPAYVLSVPVAVETAAGTEWHTVPLEDEETTVKLPTASAPVAVEIDPKHDLFRHLLPEEAPPILRDVTLADSVAVVIAAEGRAAEAAHRLAQRLLDGPLHRADAIPPDRPAMIIGTHDGWQRRLDFKPIPPSLTGRGTAQVWAEHPADAPPRLWVAAEDEDAIDALLRPLPHYGRAGWLIFEGARVAERGLWPNAYHPLRLLLQ